MKFTIAKKDGIQCGGCPGEIMRGDDMVQNFIPMNNGKQKIICFHAACYIPWYSEMFNSKWRSWKNGEGNIVRPKVGRPTTYSRPTKEQELNKLRSALSYHKKCQNQDSLSPKKLEHHAVMIKIIQNKIAKLV